MFGLIVSGRLPQTNFAQISETKLLIDIPDIENVNYMVVFLTGTKCLPPGIGAAVYFSWPNPQGTATWLYLGYITNNKASAIFKIVNIRKMQDQVSTNSMVFGDANIFPIAQLGISLEPESSIAQLNTGLETDDDSKVTFCEKMLGSFYNYAASFAANLSDPQRSAMMTGDVIPLGTLQNWYTLFRTRLQKNPNFWKY